VPGCGIHLLLASRVLAAEQEGTAPAVRDAFLAGSVAPDMGYFPGGERFLSDITHYHRSGQFTNNLVGVAKDDVCRAFARGWATHVIADTLIHPHINRAAGELIHGQPHHPLTYADSPTAHIRVEQGLDAVISARYGGIEWRSSRVPAWAGGLVNLLGSAVSKTYGYIPTRSELWSSCRALFRIPPIILDYGRTVGWWFGEVDAVQPNTAVRVGFSALRGVSRLAPHSLIHAFAVPVAPSCWLLEAVEEVIGGFATQFAQIEAAGWMKLPDVNLDTGTADDESKPYAPSIATAKEWQRRTQVGA
jgi:hypothetical protein